MHPFPHHYQVRSALRRDGHVTIESPGLAPIDSAAPVEFDGPGGHWSPETLLVASVADCYLLSFKAVAAASKFEYLGIECAVRGKLDRVERTSLFVSFDIEADLKVPAGADRARAQQLLEKAKSVCLISNSLKAEMHLVTTIRE